MHTKALLAALHPARHLYHSYKDQALLGHVLNCLAEMRAERTDGGSFTDIDAESFFRLVLIVRGIAVSRPHNLVRFADSNSSIDDGPSLNNPLTDLRPVTAQPYRTDRHLVYQLVEVMWLLHSLNPDKPALAPVIVPGLKHTEQLVYSIVEVVHAFNACDSRDGVTIAVYMQLLLSEDQQIAFTARQAICRVLRPRTKRRRVFIPSPPHCITPPEHKTSEVETHEEVRQRTRHAGASSSTGASASRDEDRIVGRDNENGPYQQDVDSVETIAFLQRDGIQASNANHPHQPLNLNPLEALLGGGGLQQGGAFPQLLDIPPDADDETMVELAIALSLQEHELTGELRDLHQQGAVIAGQALQSLQQVLAGQGVVGVGPSGAHAQDVGAGHYSDTTASATGSDDEGSTAATDGSTLRTSPAEQG